VNRVETLKTKLQATIDQKKHKEEANHELKAFLAALKSATLTLHAAIRCPEIHNDSDMKKILGDVEEQIVTVLQKYSIKMEAKKQGMIVVPKRDDGNSDTLDNNQNTSPGKPLSGGSPGARRRPSTVERQQIPPENAGQQALPPPLSYIPPPDLQPGCPDCRTVNVNGRSVAALLAREQPYRYGGLRPPHLSVDELKKKDNVEEEYPLTYDELKVKVWRSENSNSHAPS
jgi:hypothetical protein